LRAQELGGALEAAVEELADDSPQGFVACRGTFAPTLQEAPIVAMTDREPEALRGRQSASGRGSVERRKPLAPSEADVRWLDLGPGGRN
jgi:hypothetical protein